MKPKDARTLVGWQGLVAEVPGDWSLSVVSAPGRSGYFRADSPGSLSLEVKWSASMGKEDLQTSLDLHMRRMRSTALKRKLGFEHKSKVRDDGAVTFSWVSDRRGQGRIWRCGQCRRIIIAQITGEPGDNVADVASAVLQTVRDHLDDGWQPWAVYNLIADVPPGYKLVRHRMLSGYVELAFAKGLNRLTLERWGLARTVLSSTDLRTWYLQRAGPDVNKYRCEAEEVSVKGERGFRFNGRARGVGSALRSLGAVLTLREPADRLDVWVWESRECNKIYAVQSVHGASEAVAEEVSERIVCR